MISELNKINDRNSSIIQEKEKEIYNLNNIN
jgi:hypothetical protein